MDVLKNNEYHDFDAGFLGPMFQGLGQIFQSSAKSIPKAEAEAVCGKQPHGVFGFKTEKKKEEIAEWNRCLQNITQSQLDIAQGELTIKEQEEEKKKEKIKSIIIYTSVSLAVLTIIFFVGLIIYKRRKKLKIKNQ